MSFEAVASVNSVVHNFAIQAVFKQMLCPDFTVLFAALNHKNPADAQLAFADLPQAQSHISFEANSLLRTDAPCPCSTVTEQIPWSVLVACSLFACPAQETGKPKLFPRICAGKQGRLKKQYRCTKCGNAVVVEQTLRPDEQNCPICSGHLAYKGSAI